MRSLAVCVLSMRASRPHLIVLEVSREKILGRQHMPKRVLIDALKAWRVAWLTWRTMNVCAENKNNVICKQMWHQRWAAGRQSALPLMQARPS
eukprot:SAG11_NODE_1477_length_4837_cov_2.462431_3_plen_93_part_00